jgi:hypothetical protein
MICEEIYEARRAISIENFTNNQAVYMMPMKYVQLSHFGVVEHCAQKRSQQSSAALKTDVSLICFDLACGVATRCGN